MFLRLIPFLALILVTAPIASSAADAQVDEFFIGHLRADTVDYIMQYKNGVWRSPSADVPRTLSRPMSIDQYARTYWKREPEIFSAWYEINSVQPVIVRSKDVSIDFPRQCEGAVLVMRTDGGGKDGPGRAWVATRKSGLRWNDFKDAGYVTSNPEYPMIKSSPVAPIRKEYEPLIAQVKSKWLALEPEVNPASDLGANFKQRLRSADFEEILVQRSVLSNHQTFVYFLGLKKVRSVIAWYRGWALVEPDGSVSWPFAAIALPGGPTTTMLFPDGILEVGKKLYLFANVNSGYRTEKWVFEFTNAKFNYQTNALMEMCLPD